MTSKTQTKRSEKPVKANLTNKKISERLGFLIGTNSISSEYYVGDGKGFVEALAEVYADILEQFPENLLENFPANNGVDLVKKIGGQNQASHLLCMVPDSLVRGIAVEHGKLGTKLDQALMRLLHRMAPEKFPKNPPSRGEFVEMTFVKVIKSPKRQNGCSIRVALAGDSGISVGEWNDVDWRSVEKLSERSVQAIEDLNMLKLPEMREVAAELSSQKQNRLGQGVIASAGKNLGSLLEATVDRYDELGTELPNQARPTKEVIIRLLEHSPDRVQEQVYKHLREKLGHGVKSQFDGGISVPVKTVESLVDIDRLKAAYFRKLVFGDAEPSKEGFVEWFEKLSGQEIADRNIRRSIVGAITFYGRRYKKELLHQGARVSLSIATGSGRGIGGFQIHPKKGESGAAKGLGPQLPKELKLA